ncbi:MAG: hypothetical protein FD159_2033 [Syntrophaceae bacterium]|nr:MAG: hypothetical protein FD159_2033 [Syntrophaceae bacterium]
MRAILKGAVLLFIFIMTLSVMSCAKTGDTELFVHKSPDFTLTVPKWVDQKASQDPNNIFRRRPYSGSATTIDVAVKDLPVGRTYSETPTAFKNSIENLWKGSDVKILYEREIKLKDGTQAYEFEVKWKYEIWPLRSYAVIVFKDNKAILAVVTSLLWVGDSLKQFPLSLTLK